MDLEFNILENEFVTYEIALALKELGFDEPCLAQYKKYDVGEATLDIGFSKNEIIMQFHKLNKFCSAPTFSQAFRFFREKYDILHNIFFIEIENVNKFSASLKTVYHKKWTHLGFIENVNSYEEAELECLKKLIEIVKENK